MSRAEAPSAGRVRDPMLLVLVVIAGHLPFLLVYFHNLWRYRPHYEFFPLMLAAFAWLVWVRWPSPPAEHARGTRLLSLGLLAAGLVCLGGSLLLFSPWVAAVASLLSCGGLLLALGGRAAIAPLAPVWLMLCILIPPPFRLDNQLIRFLQQLTATSCSALLDAVNVDHLLSGNVFRLPDRELFVAEACSGVHSQLALLAVCVLLVVVFRRPPLHALLMLVASVFWSAVVNIARVTIVVLAAAGWGQDLSTGWVHELLGYVLTAAGVLLLFSTDQLLLGLLAPVRERQMFDTAADLVNCPMAADRLSQSWNHLVSGRWQSLLRLGPTVACGGRWQLAPVCRPQRAAALAAALGVLQICCLAMPGESRVVVEGWEQAFAVSWLPEEIGGWRRGEYRVEQRDRSSDEGQFSRVWQYRRAEHAAQISVDYPFLGWHDLTRCYLSQGWLEVARETCETSPDGERTEPFVQVQLRRTDGATGLLLFSMMDGQGRPVVPRVGHWRGLRSRLARNPLLAFLATDGPTVAAEQPTLQMQQLIVGSALPSDAERREAQALYLAVRAALGKRWLHFRDEEVDP
jgi:exosortase